jgi:hypothetical protein
MNKFKIGDRVKVRGSNCTLKVEEILINENGVFYILLWKTLKTDPVKEVKLSYADSGR